MADPFALVGIAAFAMLFLILGLTLLAFVGMILAVIDGMWPKRKHENSGEPTPWNVPKA